MPLTGDELRWLMSLTDPKKPANAAWWAQASQRSRAWARTGRTGVLNLRHAEADPAGPPERHPEPPRRHAQELLSELRARSAAAASISAAPNPAGTWVHETLDSWGEQVRAT
jgi:hypothetical protein